MLSFPKWMTFSTGILAFVIYGASVNAQMIPTAGPSQVNLESSELFPVPSKAADLMEPPETTPVPRVSEMLKLAQEPSPSNTQQTSPQQTSPQQTSPQTPQPSSQSAPGNAYPPPPVPPYLNPGANPLLIPNSPNQVDIGRVQPITLEQAVELAINNNEEIKQARFALQRAGAQLREAQSLQFPTVNTNFDFERQSDPSIDQSRQRANENNVPLDFNFLAQTTNNGQIELNYNVYSAGERPARILAARKEVNRNQLEVERVAEEVRFNTTEAYYLLQRADAQVAIAQAAVEDASVSLRDARLLEQAGLGTRFSVLQAEVDLARANQDLTRAIADQRTARRRLAQVLNVGQTIELTAADEIREAGTWPISLEQTIVQAYHNRAELEQQILQREIYQQTSYAELASVKPQVDFIARYLYTDTFEDRLSVADGYAFIARLRWLIFDGGRAEARARQNYRNMDIANAEFARLRNEIRFNVEQAYYDLIANQENIQTANTNVITATESLRLARLRFQAGVGTQIDVINSQRDLTQARSDYLQAVIDYNRSLNQLQRQVSNWPANNLFDKF
nr:TolC family protein [Gloeothece verrucosa]